MCLNVLYLDEHYCRGSGIRNYVHSGWRLSLVGLLLGRCRYRVLEWEMQAFLPDGRRNAEVVSLSIT